MKNIPKKSIELWGTTLSFVRRGDNKFVFIATVFIAFFFIPSFAFSQSQPDPAYKYFQLMFPDADPSTLDALNAVRERAKDIVVSESISLGLTPPSPGPMEDVLVKTTGSGTDLMRADFSWYVDGKLKDSGIGKISFSFKTGSVGRVATVRVVIKTIEGLRVEKSIAINPADLELVWETDGYVPPFYKGKALPTPQSRIKIVAVPNFISTAGKSIDQNTLIYSWKDEDANAGLPDNSGYGKKMLSLQMPILIHDRTISVGVSSLGNSIRAKKEIMVSPESVRVLFYESNPVEGVRYENTLGATYNLDGEEFSIKAEPYFFSTKDRNSGKLSYGWLLGNKKVVPDSSEIITFKQEGGGTGAETVLLAVRNIANLFQQSSASFVLNFKK